MNLKKIEQEALKPPCLLLQTSYKKKQPLHIFSTFPDTPLLTGRDFCVLVKPTPSQTSGTTNPWQKSNCAPPTAENIVFYRIFFRKKETKKTHTPEKRLK